jgi:hypothetical protein
MGEDIDLIGGTRKQAHPNPSRKGGPLNGRINTFFGLF